MNIIVERFKKIQSNITSLKNDKPVNIIAVSKTFSIRTYSAFDRLWPRTFWRK